MDGAAPEARPETGGGAGLRRYTGRVGEAVQRALGHPWADPVDRLWRVAFLLCGVLALGTIWLHRYPVGIDLPQHANLFRLWYAVWRGPIEYRELYHLEWFTPYLLPYLVGGVLTGLGGGLFATKCLLTLGVFGTPIMMRRWLVSVGGDPRLALFGFVFAFGYAYIWGFLSNLLALPLMLAYLAEFERQGERPGLRSILATSGLGLALFFTHGITFAPAALSVGLRVLRLRPPFVAVRKTLHLVPIVAVMGIWVLTHRSPLASTKPVWFLDFDRFVSLWSTLFWPFAHAGWEHVALGGMAVFLFFARPKLVFEPRRWIPFLVAVGGFAVLPEMVVSTWQVGNRWLLYVQAFAPGVIQPRHSGRLGKLLPCVSAALVAGALVLLNVRTSAHNRELSGLRKLTALVEPESDIQNVVAVFGHEGKTFGYNEIGQTPGWVTAEKGGMLDNESARHFHVPVQRKPGPWITRYRYVFVRGPWSSVEPYVAANLDHPILVAQKRDWYLFEHPPLAAGDVQALRSVQGWEVLKANSALDGKPLSIGGERFSDGFGTHVPSLIRVRLARPARVFEGGYGIDDGGWKTVRAKFRIRDDSGRVLFLSDPVSSGPVKRFSVPLAGQRELLLEVLRQGDIIGGHVDWVELRAR